MLNIEGIDAVHMKLTTSSTGFQGMNEIDKELNSNEEQRMIFLITYIIM
ncbi:hypothetical protein [Bacillus thuringiensis]|nr:hypothetical protein [Bacillus thuringiensis]MEC3015580.1 hypothetical protein [Bacillus cereus]MRC62998.1 hypothetical protein [Bacillus thuringiensis]